MRYRALDINLLMILDLLLDTGSLTRTGETLGLSQPAISAALGRLRDHFGDELFVLSGRINVPTPLAEKMRQPLKAVLKQTDGLVSMRAGFDPRKDARHFSLVASEYVTNVLGDSILRTVANAGPLLRVEINPILPECFDQFDRGEIEMAIVPSQIGFPSHPRMELFEDCYVCVIWKEHPTIGDALSLEQYLSAGHVVRSQPKRARRTVIDKWFLEQSSLERRIVGEMPAFTDLVNAIVGTSLIATLQRRLAEKFARHLPIRILAAPIDFPKLPIILQWHSHLDQDEGLCWFRNFIRDISAPLSETAPPSLL